MSNDYRDYEPVNLAQANFYRHELEQFEIDNIENAFAGDVARVLARINDGKEATVYLCEAANPEAMNSQYLAAKIYRANKFRHFNNDRSYRNLGKMRDRRMAKAMKHKSKKGQSAFREHWIESEFETLEKLFKGGVSCPRPYAWYEDGILMSAVLAKEDGLYVPAPRLIDCKPEQEQVGLIMSGIIEDIKKMVSMDVVHGDLSAYNILFDGQRHIIIDVPQAVDPQLVPDAYNLLQRDLTNLARYFQRFGLELPVTDLMIELM